MRANLLDVLNMQYVQTARAKGLHGKCSHLETRLSQRHPPIDHGAGQQPARHHFRGNDRGACANLPTTGPLYFNALIQKDMYLAGAFLVFLAIALLLGNLGADILLAWVDPRIRYE